MAVAHQVDIADPIAQALVDPRHAHQMQGSDQHFGLTRQHLGRATHYQHPVLRRDAHRAARQPAAKRARRNRHRAQGWLHDQTGQPQIAASDQGNRLHAAVTRQNHVAHRPFLDPAQAYGCRDQRAGGKAGNDVFNLGEGHRAENIAFDQPQGGAIVECGRTRICARSGGGERRGVDDAVIIGMANGDAARGRHMLFDVEVGGDPVHPQRAIPDQRSLVGIAEEVVIIDLRAPTARCILVAADQFIARAAKGAVIAKACVYGIASTIAIQVVRCGGACDCIVGTGSVDRWHDQPLDKFERSPPKGELR